MNSKLWFQDVWHPSNKDLILYLDGELHSKLAAKVRMHLEACWSCRVKREQIENSISTFTKYRNAILPPSADHPPGLRRQSFEAKLQELDSEADEPTIFNSLHDLISLKPGRFRLLFRLVTSSVAFLLILFIVLRLRSVSPVSAQEILRHSQLAEAQRVHQIAEPVTHQKLRVRRKPAAAKHEEMVTWEIWNDARNDRFRARVEDVNGSIPVLKEERHAAAHPSSPSFPPVLAELDQIFRSNHLDHRQPLSPAAYYSWRASIRPESEKVVEAKLRDGDKALAVTTTATGPFAVNAIIQAELVVRAEDWHPVEQRLKVQGENETRDYELTETTFQVVSLRSLSPLIFSDLPAVPSAPIAATPPRVSKPTSAALPSEAELLAAELEAHYALHRVKACRGEQIEVTRNPSGHIQVSGLVDTGERKEQLLTALQSLAGVIVTIQTNQEAESLQSRVVSRPEAKQEVSPPNDYNVTVQADKLPIFLKQYLAHHPIEGFFEGRPSKNEPIGDNAKTAWLSYQTVSLSEAALSEAWALRRLAEEYPLDKTSHLQARPKLLLETMVRDHLTELRTTISRSRTLLEPILASLLAENALRGSEEQSGRPAQPLIETPSWTNKTFLVFGTVEKIDGFIHGLFSSPGLPADQTEGATRELLSALHRCEAEVNRLEAAVAQAFRADVDSISMKHQPE